MPIKKLLDKTFFDSWTPASSYLLGLLIADGTLTTNPRGSQYVELISTDRELVKLFRSCLRSNHKIALKKRKSPSPLWKPAYRIQIGNQALLSRLSDIGLSRKNTVPHLPRKYCRDFVRGFFDGDGCVMFSSYYSKSRKKIRPYFQVVFTCRYRRFLRQLHSVLQRNAQTLGGSLYKGMGAYRLSYSQNDGLKLFNFLYRDVGHKLKLARKYRTFKKAACHFGVVV